MANKIIFKKDEEVMLDTLMSNCGHHTDCDCHNGFNCRHPKLIGDGSYTDDCEKGCDGCFAFNCPLAYQKNSEEDDKNARWGDETVMVLHEDLVEGDALVSEAVE